MENAVEAIKELGQTFEEFKKANDKKIEKIEQNGGTAELKEMLDKINTAMDKQEKDIEQLATAMNRPGAGSNDGDKSVEKEAKRVMNEFMRKGVDTVEGKDAIRKHLAQEYDLSEEKLLSIDSDPNGGYLVRPEFSNEIIKDLREISPIRQIADVKTISSDAYELAYNVGGVSSGWVGEKQSRTETDNSKVNMIRIPVHEIYAMPKATQKLLDDSFVNVEQWHGSEVLEEFSVQEGTGFVLGNGILKPKGFLDYAAGSGFDKVEQVATGHATVLQADSFFKLQDSLKEQYQANAKWTMSRATRSVIRQMKDGDNRYLFSLDAHAGLNDGAPMQLLGQPIVIATDMPTIAANSLSVAYGDFKKGYQIVDRVGIRILRDSLTEKGFVLFYTTKRVGGGVKQFAAIKILKTSV